MMTRKHTINLTQNAGGTHFINNRRQKVPATVVWSGIRPPALLVTNGRKLVNPVNGLSVNIRGPPPPPPLPPPPLPPVVGMSCAPFGIHKNSLNTASNQCCTCCYCCCDSEKGSGASSGQAGNNHHHNHTSKQPTRSKTWRRRSRSKEKIGQQYSVDVRRLIPQNNESGGGTTKPKFIPVTTLEDTQAIRCAEFHPQGHLYAVGSNSKVLRICAYPPRGKLTEEHTAKPPNVLYKRMKHHRGSIYCCGWSPDGNLLATGSNDKTVKLIRFEDMNREDFTHTQEVELTMHDGTIRDVCFIEDLSNKASLLVSGGAGDCKIYVTDCMTATPFQALAGHSAPVLSLYNWGGVMFCSGSQDKSIRVWDLRTRGCVNLISPLTSATSSTTKSPVGSVCVDPTGRLLVSGHEDSAIVLYDIRGNRQIQTFKPHAADVRSVRFSPKAYYLLSAGYDQRLMLTDLQGDLSLNLNSVPVASHEDKIISGRWHPTDFSFLSTSADKTVKLWSLPSQ
ncbi:unnamed protein product [Allacma fusca]|uniref:WD repeat-containing protein 47 n=1 Tax=Allacma fusca TaxID=39272 RepID=A0A8J2PGV5_9HEXA|nr:unnamed protein product [Allacma fusca]